MTNIKPESVKFINTIDDTIFVMRNAASWLLQSGNGPSEYWHLDILTRDYLLQHAQPEDFYTGIVDGNPAVACLLQDNERNQSWQYIDKNMPKRALYIHWLCVAREYSGRGLPAIMINFAFNKAKSMELPFLRLDTETNRPKLMEIYRSLGFTLMGIADGTAFFQMEVIK